jgi:hypothetical protein
MTYVRMVSRTVIVDVIKFTNSNMNRRPASWFRLFGSMPG